MKKSEEKLLHANIAVVSAGIEACKVKTAARSFESLIAFLSFCGVDVGNIGHGRNQFPDIINAAYHYILLKTKQYLEEPLPNTGLPPHFSTAVDKSTPHRDTNQAVVIILPVNGVRIAVPNDAPLVYKVVDAGTHVEGGKGSDLADQLVTALKKVEIEEDTLLYMRAVHADGQY